MLLVQCIKMAGVKRKMYAVSDANLLHKELDEVSCPICMDHPHNAVLLICSSFDKGCRSYICDTSHRHSNCLDRFKKLESRSTINTSEGNSGSGAEGTGIQNVSLSRTLDLEEDGSLGVTDSLGSLSGSRLALNCPLCRGKVLGWKAVDEAREYLNMKKRNCSCESCSFTGNYQELRAHARRVHPATRPSDIDPTREQAWQRLESQREYGDIVSAVRSAIPGAVVVGDYVIENAGDSSTQFPNLLLFQIGAIDRGGSGGGGVVRPRQYRSRAWRRYRRLPERRLLWGERLLGAEEGNVNHDRRVSENAGRDVLSSVPLRRRRRGRSRSDEDHP